MIALRNLRRLAFTVLALTAVSAALSGCGRKGPPVKPSVEQPGGGGY